MDMLMVAIAPLAALLGLVGAAYFAVNVMGKPKGTERMREIAQAISEGAMAYMSRQFRTIAPFAVLLALIFAFALPDGPAVAAAFLFGAISSALAAYIGMALAVRANVRAAQAAESGLNSALQVAIRGGAVTGLAVVTGLFAALPFIFNFVAFLAAAAVSGVLTEQHQRLVAGFLRHCDLVKFAQYVPTVEEMERGFTAVLQFVDETVPIPAPAEKEAAA